MAARSVAVALAAALALGACQGPPGGETETLERAPGAPPLTRLAERPAAVAIGQLVYVPVYSHIYTRGGRERWLEVTLSIRNTDPKRSMVVESVRYFDNDGVMIKSYLDSPVLLGPLASTDFLIERRDTAGGVGANFLVEWLAEEVVSEPIIEAVMVSSEGNQAFAFVRPGRALSSSDRSE